MMADHHYRPFFSTLCYVMSYYTLWCIQLSQTDLELKIFILSARDFLKKRNTLSIKHSPTVLHSTYPASLILWNNLLMPSYSHTNEISLGMSWRSSRYISLQLYKMWNSSPSSQQVVHSLSARGVLFHRPVSIFSLWDPSRNLIIAFQWDLFDSRKVMRLAQDWFSYTPSTCNVSLYQSWTPEQVNMTKS